MRDLLLGREPKDFDVATSATPDVVLGLFERTFAVGAHFGVVLVATCGGAAAACAGTCGAADAAYAAGAELAGPEYVVTEVATFRSDGAYSDGRHPDAVRYTRRAEEDVRRRDFTINGLLLDPEKLFPQGIAVLSHPSHKNKDVARVGHPADLWTSAEGLRSAVIDFVGGVEDLDAGVVRAIGRAEERFLEDHLRMLRGARFAARFGFELEAGTRAAMQGLAGRIQAVSRERVRDELTKMLTEGRALRAFELLEETGLLKEVLPEVARMKGVEQPARRRLRNPCPRSIAEPGSCQARAVKAHLISLEPCKFSGTIHTWAA